MKKRPGTKLIAAAKSPIKLIRFGDKLIACSADKPPRVVGA